jgi:hypothetical protein
MAARNKAIAYAEDTLGVNTLQAEVLELENKLRSPSGLLRQAAIADSQVRLIEKSISERTIELRIESRGDNPEMSATAFEAHLKVVIASDEKLLQLNDDLEMARQSAEMVAAEAREVELAHRSRVARMNMLGGYMQYLAAAKNAVTAARTGGQDWPY